MVQLLNDLPISFFLIHAYRDLSRSYKSILSIIITLFLSLFILSSIFTVKDNLEESLKINAKTLLGGDLEIDYNRVEGDKLLLDKISKFSLISKIVEFNTMISTINKRDNITSYIRIKSVDKNYPLFGKVLTEPKNILKKINDIDNTIIVNENIFKKLNLKLNDKIKLQNKEFIVIGLVKNLPDIGGAFVFGDFAITGEKIIEILNLKNFGSFLSYEYKVKFSDTIDRKSATNKITALLSKEKNIKIRSPENSAIGIKNFIDNFSQFLSLISISTILIAGIGISNSLLAFINQKITSISIQKAIGMSSASIKKIFYVELIILLILISLITYGLSFLLSPIINNFIQLAIGIELSTHFSLYNFTKILFIGVLVTIIFSLPTINSIDSISSSNLLRNNYKALKFNFNKSSILYILLLSFLLITTFSFSFSKPVYSLLYFISFFVFLITFYFMSRIIIRLLKKLETNKNIILKIATKNIINSHVSTSITILSLGLGLTLLLTLSFVGSNFKREIQNSIPSIAPDYFFVGIQHEQKNPLIDQIKEYEKNVNIEVLPMVSAGIVKINGIDPNTYIDKSNGSYWVIRNNRRISWSNEIPIDNPLTKGTWWDLSKPNKLQLSIDDRVARDLGIKIGDKIILNVYGREIEGEVFNFRLVNYRDLSINFAILINPQYAINIPHEYLMTTKFNKINNFKEVDFLNKFPNVSIIKISDYLTKINDLLNKIFIGVSLIALITIVVGLVVISSTIIAQGRINIFQNLIFKILGFSRKQIIKISIYEFFIKFISIIIFSTLFSIISSIYIVEEIFRLNWKFDYIFYLNVTLGVGCITVILILFTFLKYLNPKVYPLIRNE